MKKILIFSTLIFSLASCGSNISNNKIENVSKLNTDNFQNIKSLNLTTVNVSDFKKELAKKDGTLIDLRTPGEVAEGVISGAKQIDFYSTDFKEKINSLDKNKKYLIYCRSGSRSGKTLNIMKNLGFTNVINLDGGIGAWSRAGEKISTIK